MRQSCQQRARCSLPDYAERSASFSYASAASDRPRGINGLSALWVLCRYRHNGHASGAKHRLDRDLSGRFGSNAYAAEECCVEILSGLILADLGIAHHPRPDHAAYIASWLKVLRDDPKAIFTAASKAQQAADWMHARQSQGEEIAA